MNLNAAQSRPLLVHDIPTTNNNNHNNHVWWYNFQAFSRRVVFHKQANWRVVVSEELGTLSKEGAKIWAFHFQIWIWYRLPPRDSYHPSFSAYPAHLAWFTLGWTSLEQRLGVPLFVVLGLDSGTTLVARTAKNREKEEASTHLQRESAKTSSMQSLGTWLAFMPNGKTWLASAAADPSEKWISIPKYSLATDVGTTMQ